MKPIFTTTADDFGVTKIIDQAIIKAVDTVVDNNTNARAIQGVACIANGPRGEVDFERVIELDKKIKSDDIPVDIGCHLNITNGYSLSDLANLDSEQELVDEKGEFHGIFWRNLEDLDLDLLYNELWAQVERFIKAEIEIKHFSDHFGVLTAIESNLLEVVLDVVERYSEFIGKAVPLRNPVILSAYLPKRHKLSRSKLQTNVKIANFLRKYLVGELGERNLSRESLLDQLSVLHGEDYTWHTDFFLDQFYNISKSKTVRRILSLDLDKPAEYASTKRNIPIYEMVVHLAVDEADYVIESPGESFDTEFEIARQWRIRKGALVAKRERELKFLLEEFVTHHKYNRFEHLPYSKI